MIKDLLAIQTYIHAREKQKRVPKMEPLIALNGEVSYFYALRILNGRFFDGEKQIAKTPKWAIKYARFILRNRFEKAEKNIAKNPEWCYEYYKFVIKRKLPKKLHNAMIMFSYEDPSNYFVTKYFKELK